MKGLVFLGFIVCMGLIFHGSDAKHLKKNNINSDEILPGQGGSNSLAASAGNESLKDSKEVDFKSFGDFASQTNKYQKDFTQQLLELKYLDDYQERFLIISLIAILTVALCCFGVNYILAFAKQCKIAFKEIEVMKAHQEQLEKMKYLNQQEQDNFKPRRSSQLLSGTPKGPPSYQEQQQYDQQQQQYISHNFGPLQLKSAEDETPQ